MTVIKALVILAIIAVYFLLFVVKWFEYENKNINNILKNNGVNYIANEVEE
jgi:uncharacterized membrane protein YkgB